MTDDQVLAVWRAFRAWTEDVEDLDDRDCMKLVLYNDGSGGVNEQRIPLKPMRWNSPGEALGLLGYAPPRGEAAPAGPDLGQYVELLGLVGRYLALKDDIAAMKKNRSAQADDEAARLTSEMRGKHARVAVTLRELKKRAEVLGVYRRKA